jgi:hypothetical protein
LSLAPWTFAIHFCRISSVSAHSRETLPLVLSTTNGNMLPAASPMSATLAA